MGGSGHGAQLWGGGQPVAQPVVGSARGEKLWLLAVAARLHQLPQHIVVTSMLFS
jgi:hypothetical protein